MQKLIQSYAFKTCLTIMSLLLVSQGVIANESDTRMSYLDSVSSSYLYNKTDNSQKILNINSTEAQGFEATFKLDTKPVITNSKAKVKLSLRDSDIKQVLRMLADKAGVNIVFDYSVDGRITLDLNDIDINDAFLVIFKTMQFTYTMDGNTLTVMTLDAYKELGYLRQNMTVLPVKYVNADNVATFLNDNLFSQNIFGLSNKPIVTSNPRSNQIVVFGTDADITAIKRILPVLDTKPFINTFKVNHTTPGQMANMICDSLFYNAAVKDFDIDESRSIRGLELGGGKVACRDQSEESEGGYDNGKPTGFKDNPLTIMYFSQSGEVGTVGGSVEQIEVIREFIKRNDKKSLMAYVELSVIELNEAGSKEFSNTWNLWTPFLALGFDPAEGLTTNSSSPLFLWGNKYTTMIKRVDKNGHEISDRTYVAKSNNKALVYQLKYLVENGNGRVLTNPKIMITNGQRATIDMTSDYVKSVTSQVLEGSGGIASATQKSYNIGSDEGLKIDIDPLISPDGYVTMNITPEFATIKERIMAANDHGDQELAATLLQRRDLNVRGIRIKDGETLVLAGLIKEQEQQTVQKMPILSDLPFVGAFFRGNANKKAREELVIVVTPHIVKENDTNDNVYDL